MSIEAPVSFGTIIQTPYYLQLKLLLFILITIQHIKHYLTNGGILNNILSLYMRVDKLKRKDIPLSDMTCETLHVCLN